MTCLCGLVLPLLLHSGYGGSHLPRVLTFLGYDNPQQWIGRGHSFVEVLVVVDGQEVPVDVCVAQQHIHPTDVVDVLEEAVELLEVSRSTPLQTKPAIFCVKLPRKRSIR